MTDNELLLAISGLLDKKLKAELQPLKDDMKSFGEKLDSFGERLDSLEKRMDSLEKRMDSLEKRMDSLEKELHSVKIEIHTIKKELSSIKLYQENVLLPRLVTIESCYTETYKRYRDNNERIESFFEDVDLLKKVVTEHSTKLQMIS